MLKRPITYEDFDGETVTEEFYFNITKSEIIELEVGHGEGGIEAFIKRVVNAKDNKELIAEFKRIILLAYGIKSPDGKRFIKSDELRTEFEQTAAFDALFIELATSDDAAAKFIQGILPRDMSEQVAQQDKPILPPPPRTQTPEVTQ